MRWIISAVIILVVLTAVTAHSEDELKFKSKEELDAWIEKEKSKPPEKVPYELDGKPVSYQEFTEHVKGQFAQEVDNYKSIQETGKMGYDEEGRIQYETPDGVKHSFFGDSNEAVTVEDYIKRVEKMQKDVQSSFMEYYPKDEFKIIPGDTVITTTDPQGVTTTRTLTEAEVVKMEHVLAKKELKKQREERDKKLREQGLLWD